MVRQRRGIIIIRRGRCFRGITMLVIGTTILIVMGIITITIIETIIIITIIETIIITIIITIIETIKITIYLALGVQK